MHTISYLVSIFFDVITLILLVGVLLSWVPNINWFNEPFKSIRLVCDFCFAPFRKLIPPISGIDFSPIIAFIVIGFIGNVIVEILRGMNL